MKTGSTLPLSSILLMLTIENLSVPTPKQSFRGLNQSERTGLLNSFLYITSCLRSSMIFSRPSSPPETMMWSRKLTQLISWVWILAILWVIDLVLQSQIPISLSCPPLTHTSLFLKEMSSTISCPSNVRTGFRAAEPVKQVPTSLLVGPRLSRSKSSILLPPAVISLMRLGANLSAQLGFSPLVVYRTVSGVFAAAAVVFILQRSDTHRKTLLVSLLEARSFLFAEAERITVTSPGCEIICLIFILGCFLTASWWNRDLSSFRKQWSGVGSSTELMMMQLGVFSHSLLPSLQSPSVRQEKNKRWLIDSSLECRILPHCREVTGQSMKFSQTKSQKLQPQSRHILLPSDFLVFKSILLQT